jgi:hypothetical protein
MALDLTDTYDGQVAEGDAGYPYGKAKNVNVEGDGSGTPWEEQIVNDWLGFFQGALVAAGITPSGTPDSATSSQYLQALYRLMGRAEGWGALGDDVSDDTAALQSALTALSALGGRRTLHLVDGRTYRHTGLSVPANVDIYFNGARLKNTHATNAHLTYAGAGGVAGSLPQNIDRAIFEASVISTGACINVTSSTRLTIRNSVASSTNVQGKFLDASTVSAVIFMDTVEWVASTSVRFVHMSAGQLTMNNCRGTISSGFAGAVIEFANCYAQLDELLFDLSLDVSGGVAELIKVTSAFARVMIGKVNVLGGLVTDIVLSWTAAAFIQEHGLCIPGNATPYAGTGDVMLANGSYLSLRPHGKFDTTDETYTIPNDYRTVSLEATWGSNPSLTAPVMRFPGQELDLQIYNASPIDFTSVAVNALGPNIDTLDGADIKTGRLKVVWDAFQDRWYWMVIGDWSPGFTRTNEVT